MKRFFSRLRFPVFAWAAVATFGVGISALAADSAAASPATPVLRLARGEDGKVTLAFTPATGAKTHAIRIADDDNVEVIENVEVSDYTVHGLTNGRRYRFSVCGVFGDGRRGPWSEGLAATPVDDPDWIALREAFAGANPTRNSNPFTMVHGRESDAELRAILRAAYDGGFEGVTLHPYNYEDYLGPGQWNRWRIIFDEAHRLGLAVWQQDDRNYPSGFAAGKVVAAHPEYGRTMLVPAAHYVVNGPRHKLVFNIASLLKDRDFLVAVAAYPMKGEPLDLTDGVAQGKLTWDAPSGQWRVFVVKAVWCKGGPVAPGDGTPKGYIDFLNPKAVDAYIETIYGATHAQFPREFGRTFKGFFSDEAPVEFRQFTPDFLERFEKAKGYSIRRWLPSLWRDLTGRDRKIRGDYRDFIREQNATVFFGRSRDWCHAHGVQLIGHVIEDHQQDMRRLESLDVPGCDNVFGQWYDPDLDVYWRLPRMASSVAHYGGSRNDVALIEHFAATGWRTGTSEMKRMMDWSTVMGINQIVPCGLDTQSPPAWEVAPDFWLHGANPQWPYFREYQAAANRMTMLMRGGRHVAPAIVLDTTESQWAKDGAFLGEQHGARDELWKTCAAMGRAHVDFDLIPYAVFTDSGRAAIKDGRVWIGKEDYRAVVLPEVEYVPKAVLARLREFHKAGGVVVAVNRLPSLSCDGQHDAEVRDDVDHIWGPEARRQGKSAATTRAALAKTLTDFDVPDVRISTDFPKLLYCHRLRGGKHLYFFANTAAAPIATTIELRGVQGDPTFWDPTTGEIAPAATYSNQAGGLRLALDLGEYESLFVVVEPEGPREATQRVPPASVVVLRRDWRAARGTAAHHRIFSTDVRLPANWPSPASIRLELHDASQIVSVAINGVSVGRRFCAPYRFEVGKAIRPGANHIQVERIGRATPPNAAIPPSAIDDDRGAAPCSRMTISAFGAAR